MKYFNNNRLIMAGSVFLLLVGTVYFAFQLFQQGEVADLLRNELNKHDVNQASTFRGMQSSDQELINAATKDLPTFKNASQSNVDEIANSQVDFPKSTKLEIVEKGGNNTPSANNVATFRADNGTVIRADNGSATFSGGSVSPIFQTSNTISKTNKPNNTEIQSPIVFGTSPSFSKNSSNTFLANNSLSLTTDLSGNNSPMLIDGETNPGDPGVSVGDGTWVLMGLLVGYGLILRGKAVVLRVN